MEAKTLRKFDKLRSSINDSDSVAIDDRRLQKRSTTGETNLEAHDCRTLQRKKMTKARILTAMSKRKSLS